MTENRYDRDTTWRARYRTFIYAGRGIVTLLATQWNARIHLAIAVAVVALGCIVHLSPIEWSLIIFAIALVWVTEAVNTAIEFLVDLLKPEIHPLAGRAKDVAAGAVLSAAIAAMVVGLIIFIPKMLALGAAAGANSP